MILASITVRPAVPGPKTIIVLGAFRGGTSHVAELLVEIDMPMGCAWSPVTPREDYVSYEDAELATALDPLISDWTSNQGYSLSMLKFMIANRNAQYATWGFKKPSAVFIIDKLLPLFRNPHVVAVVRDPLASHQSGQAHGVTKPGSLTIPDCRAHFAAVMDVVDRPRCPTMAISYERMKEDVVGTRLSLVDFVFGDGV